MFTSIAVIEKKLYIGFMKYLSYTILFCFSLFSYGCAGTGETVKCPLISAPEEGVRAFVRSKNNEQIFEVRLNGVTANCEPYKSGGTLVNLTVGLKLDRERTERAEADVINVPMMIALVDDQEVVVGNDELGYRVRFDDKPLSQYFTAEFKQVVPANSRLVISLKPSD